MRCPFYCVTPLPRRHVENAANSGGDGAYINGVQENQNALIDFTHCSLSFLLSFFFFDMSAIIDTFSSQNNPTLRIAAATSGAAAAILGALALKYNDRAVFRERPKGVTFVPGHPLIGTLWMQLSNKHRIYDALLENFEKYDAVTM